MANAEQIENQSYLYSAVLHLTVLLIGIFGLPEIWRQHRDALPTAMTVEVLPIGQTNIKPKQKSKKVIEKPKPEPAKPQKPAWAQPRVPEPKIEAKPVPAPPKPVEKKKETPKPIEEPKKQEKPKEPEMDLADILRSVEEAAQSESDIPSANNESSEDSKQAISDNYNDALPLAMSEIDAIRQQIIRNWNIPAGAKNAHNLIIVLDIQLTTTGHVTSVELAQDKSRYYSDSFFRAAADSAIRAVRRSSPIQNLPTDKYNTWKHIELHFDPKELLY